MSELVTIVVLCVVCADSRLGEVIEEDLHRLVDVWCHPWRIDDIQLGQVLRVILGVEVEALSKDEQACAMLKAQTIHIEDGGDTVHANTASQTGVIEATLQHLDTVDVRVHEVIDRADLLISQCGSGDKTGALNVNRSALEIGVVVSIWDDGTNALLVWKVWSLEDGIDVVLLTPFLSG